MTDSIVIQNIGRLRLALWRERKPFLRIPGQIPVVVFGFLFVLRCTETGLRCWQSIAGR